MPSSPFLAACRDYISTSVTDREFRLIRAAWKIEYALGWNYAVTQAVSDVPIRRGFVLLQCAGFGSSHHETDAAACLRTDCIGRDVLSLDEFPIEYQIAALDAAAAAVLPCADETILLKGNLTEKHSIRTSLLVREALAALKNKSGGLLSVAVVGALSSLAGAFSREANVKLRMTDADPAVIGRNYHGCVVLASNVTPAIVRESDVALVTGMALPTDTIDSIFQAAREGNTRLVFFLQSGANLAVPYLSAGAAAVISEPYPFYFMAPGESLIRVYRSAASL